MAQESTEFLTDMLMSRQERQHMELINGGRVLAEYVTGQAQGERIVLVDISTERRREFVTWKHYETGDAFSGTYHGDLLQAVQTFKDRCGIERDLDGQTGDSE